MNTARSYKCECPRRRFLRSLAVGGCASAFGLPSLLAAESAASLQPPIVVFSKIYQELKLSFEDSASLTAEAGLQGVDCTVRPGGEVLPERVADDLPRYHEALRKHRLEIPLLTTAIVGTDSPQTEQILRAAKQIGARFYRLGFVYRLPGEAVQGQIREWRAQLRGLATLNKELGLTALIQNHSPAGKSVYLGGDLSELGALVEGFSPQQIGIAFDIGHAIAVHGDDWRKHFEKLQQHFAIAYVKDVTKDRKWVQFGDGAIQESGYFQLLKARRYSEPFSLHIEYDWDEGGKAKNRSALLRALKESSAVLRRWYVAA
jgi:L-ribulose-5-phosphate 3-epimerase